MVGHIVAMLGKPDGWLVALCMGGIKFHKHCIVGVVLGNGGMFILAWVMLLSRNRLSLLRSGPSVCFICWRRANFCCMRCSCCFALLVSFWAMAVRSSLAWVMLLSRNRSSLLSRSCRSVCLMCWHQAIFCCLRYSRGPGGMMFLSSSICCVRLGAL